LSDGKKQAKKMVLAKQNLTKSIIESLNPSPDGKRLYYYDLKIPGLELCVTPTGAKSFAVRRWTNGRSHRVMLGKYSPLALQPREFDADPLIVLEKNPTLTIEHARQLAQAVLGQLAAGDRPREIKRRQGNEITLGELFEEYIDKYAMEHTKTWKVMQECFDRYLNDWKGRPVVEISRGEVQLLINKLGKERGKTTANRTLELLRAVINKGKIWSLINVENPAAGVSKFKLQSRERFVAEDELPRLIEAIEAEENAEIRDYLLISLSTGARKTNVLTMRWEHIDLESGTWTIPDTKNGTSQTILLTPDELKIIKERFDNRKSFEWVFPGPDKTKHLCDPKKGWARILKAAKIKDLHLHDLRRTLGSYMAMSGVSLSVIGNALNHKDVSTTRKVYAQSARAAERTARLQAHEKIFAKKKPEQEPSNVVELKPEKTVEF
jgi:integrase